MLALSLPNTTVPKCSRSRFLPSRAAAVRRGRTLHTLALGECRGRRPAR